MEEAVRKALAIDRTSPARDRTVDITTVGRRSGKPRRIEIWFYRADGKVYLRSLPAKRGWYANLKANPRFTFHLKNSVVADLPATAKPITEEAERRRIFAQFVDDLKQPGNPVASPSRPTSKTGWQAARLWRSLSMSRPIVADSSPGRLPQPLRPVGGPASRSPFHSRVVWTSSAFSSHKVKNYGVRRSQPATAQERQPRTRTGENHDQRYEPHHDALRRRVNRRKSA